MRVVDGTLRKGMKIKFFSTDKAYEVESIGVFAPHPTGVRELSAGEVGFLTASIKDVRDVNVGDTITDAAKPASEPLPGFRKLKPMVYSGLYPVDSAQYEELKEAVAKLHLNDASFTYEPENSLALGFGFRCGFLGLFHMEIIKERLEREYGIDLITTAPTVVYRVTKRDGEVVNVENPANLPPPNHIEKFEEPYILVTIHIPAEFVGAVIKLCEARRGIQKQINYITPTRVVLEYEMPLGEVVTDFYDRLKTISRGYASMDYEHIGYREAELVRLDILLNGEPVDALAVIVPKEKAYQRGREIVEKMREVVPRQLFDVAIQAAIGGRVIARETVKALRKNVTAKCYGGDVTRKRKLLEKQKEGKKRMKQVGRIELPQEAFLSILSTGD